MTMNPNAIAGPSKRMETPPKVEPPSPSSSFGSDLKEVTPFRGDQPGGVSKPGLSVDENGEVVKVPAFLQKLYSMVSDAGTDELIFWADSGDSFFVPDHQRFGKEILPRFFKHNNFSSFVRQLNMYGFHKVPQPQTGVLKQDNPNDSELWEFVSPFFRRGQPALLSKVTRKNNRPGIPPPTTGSTGTRSSARQAVQNATGQYLITDGTTEGEAGIVVGPTGQQMVDLAAITSGIQAIRQTQASIGADLKALQTSNEHLWRESMEQRERHRKHQETIDLIVTFLERLFGTEGEGLKGLKEAMRRGGLGGLSRPREDSGSDVETVGKKRKRLGLERMIADGRDEDKRDDGQIVEIPSAQNQSNDDPFQYSVPRFSRTRSSNPSSTSNDLWSATSDRFQNLPTEDDNRFQPIPSSAGSTGLPTPGDQPFATGLSPDPTTAIDPSALVRYYNSANNANANGGNVPNPAPNGTGSGNPPMSPSSTAAAASAFNLDPSILQTTIGSLLQSPAAAQMFLNSLNNSIQGQALHTPTKNPSPVMPHANHQPLNQPNFQPQFSQPIPNTNTNINAVNQNDLDPTLALFSPLPNQTALVQNNEALIKSYQDAMGVGGNVDKLQESIDDLVRSMGLDVQPGTVPLPGQSGLGDQPFDDDDLGGLDPDFNVDEFLEHLAKENEAAVKAEGGQ